MSRVSAGLLLYRVGERGLEVLLVHPGGPFFRHKDVGTWSIPKGQPREGETLFDAAGREFEEETGFAPPGPRFALTPVRQKGGKVVHAWAVCGDWDPRELSSNTAEMEWPPRSGRTIVFPEVDRAGFFTQEQALVRINPAQAALVRELAALVARGLA